MHGTVQDDKSEESDNDDKDDLDKNDNVYTDFNNAALDKEYGIDDSDNFYKSILSDEWEWKELILTTNIPIIPYHYNDPHGLKPGIEKGFITVLESIFETIGLDLDYFQCIIANSNKYAHSKLPGYNKFGEMFQLLGIVLRMSIEPEHLGGYEAYFQPTAKLRCGPGNVVDLNNYSG
eukprot:11825480-Ditylum_brightwellii.AAC.1